MQEIEKLDQNMKVCNYWSYPPPEDRCYETLH